MDMIPSFPPSTRRISHGVQDGKPVLGIYEVPESEALDIDSFSDLQCAEAILNKRKVAIYVNGNNKRGMGHIYRALELADGVFTVARYFQASPIRPTKTPGRDNHPL